MYRRPILCACRLAKANKDNPEEADEQTATLCFAAEPKRESAPVTKESRSEPHRNVPYCSLRVAYNTTAFLRRMSTDFYNQGSGEPNAQVVPDSGVESGRFPPRADLRIEPEQGRVWEH